MIGIIGNTHGVKIAASPKPNATSRKLAKPWSSELCVFGAAPSGPLRWPVNSVNPAGTTNSGRGCAGSTLTLALRFVFARKALAVGTRLIAHEKGDFDLAFWQIFGQGNDSKELS